MLICQGVGLQLTFELSNINADEIVQFDLLFLRKDKDENKIRRDKHDLFQGMVQLQIVMNRQNIFLTKSQQDLGWSHIVRQKFDFQNFHI